MRTETNPNELLAQRLRDVGVQAGVTLSDSRPGNGTRVVIPGGIRVEWDTDHYTILSPRHGTQWAYDWAGAVAVIIDITNGGR